MKLVLVEWEDTCSGNYWICKETEEHIDRIVSIGILIREDDKEVEIVPNISSVHKLHQMAISKKAIKRMRLLCLH